MITSQQIRDCTRFRVTNDRADKLTFEVVLVGLRPSARQILEIICPVVQGRLSLKNAEVRLVDQEAPLPEAWNRTYIESSLEELLSCDARFRESKTFQPETKVIKEPDLSAAEQTLKEACLKYIEEKGLDTPEKRNLKSFEFAQFALNIFNKYPYA